MRLESWNLPPIQPARGERMGLKPSLSCVTHHLGSTFSRLWSGAHGSQEVVRLAAWTFEFENQSLALCQQFSTLVTPDLLQLSHFASPLSLHRTPASDSVTAPYPWAITQAESLRASRLCPWCRGELRPLSRTSLRRGHHNCPLLCRLKLSQKRKPLARTMTQTRGVFRNPRKLCKVFFSRARYLCFSQLSRIIH